MSLLPAIYGVQSQCFLLLLAVLLFKTDVGMILGHRLKIFFLKELTKDIFVESDV